MMNGWDIFGASLLVILLLLLYIALPIKMAKKRGRSAIGWVLVFFMITPLWGSIVLCVLGDSKKKIKKELLEAISQSKKEILGEINPTKNETV